MVVAALTGCANFAPTYNRPEAPVPATWTLPTPAGTASAEIGWRDFFADERLRQLVELTLANNRDLRVAALNIERTQSLYGIQRANLFPAIGATAGGSRSHTPASLSSSGAGRTSGSYSVELGFSSYELDFFGRVKNLNEAALQTFFASGETRRSTQISLVSQVATAWLTLAADMERLQLAQETLKARQSAYDLTRRAYELGGQSGLTLYQAQTTVDSARVDAAAYASQVAQDRNALDLLAGTQVPEALLPGTQGGTIAALVAVPADLPSSVLQRRPDVLAAERTLQGAYADIGAARAAFFPRITLTAAAGTASSTLSGLFKGGSGAWSFAPSISLPIFNAGANQANLEVAQADRDIAVANYEKALQTAFREVADALAQRSTIDERLAAQQSLTGATGKSLELSQARFRSGADSYLEVLVAQQSLYAAQQNSITLRLAEQTNRITLYKVLGGGGDAPQALAAAGTP
jgi:multidrug efflux system outer membrane protein